MEKVKIKNELKEIIIKCMDLNCTPEDIKGNDLINEIGMNSVDALEILVWTENTFEIQIDDEDLNADLMSSLDNLVDYILTKRGE